MSYVVLARKWRPQTFADMTGQEHIVRTLANAIEQNRVAHAYLFSGPRGVGKTTAARLLAKALNCEKGPTAQPCQTCSACTEIAKGISVDVQEIDGASNNGVENVREIRENAKFLPQRDRHKLYIIDEVHMLSTSAFNALLKTLEEPPGHVKFIFATTEAHKLPDTILSRCQRHNFRRIPAQKMQQRLKEICKAEGANLSDRALALVERQSEGGMRDALSLLDQILSAYGSAPTDEQVAEALGAIDSTLVQSFAEALVRRDAKTLLTQTEAAYNRGLDLRRMAEEICFQLRHLFVAKALGKAPEELAESEANATLALAKEADSAQLARLFDVVQGSIEEIAQTGQPRLLFEMALLKAVQLAPASALPELIRRVEALAQGGEISSPVKDLGVAGGRSPSAPFRV